jgi:predicted enzyme related to lactoylglutathione lyase
MPNIEKGSIIWQDLTVKDTEKVVDFYQKVVGWKISTQPMGDYNDFNVHSSETGEPIAGICNAKGENKHLPPQWLLYVTVESVEEAAKQCTLQGGKIIDGPRKMGDSNFCVIQDPAGAYLGLISPEEE